LLRAQAIGLFCHTEVSVCLSEPPTAGFVRQEFDD
jgi:hypothetical protein